MSVTLKQIAEKTGLSVPTVHQILNGYNVSFAEATRKKVLSAAAALDYRPNITARSLVTQRSYLIGVLFYGPNNDLVTPFMRGVQKAVKAHRCSPLFLTHDTRAEELENLQSMLDRRVDGILVNTAVDADHTTNAKRFAVVNRSGTPMVEVFGRFISDVPQVTLDYKAAAEMLTRQLIAEGHEKIALVIRSQFDETNAARIGGRYWSATDFFQGYQEQIAAAQLKPRVVKYAIEDHGSPNAVYLSTGRRMTSLFRSPEKSPAAVLCYSSESAEAVSQFYQNLGPEFTAPLTISVPALVRPPRTARVRIVSMPFPTVLAGHTAANILFKKIAGEAVANVLLAPSSSYELEKHDL